MSVWLKFAGWFQCRLATDPDPTDEPRGVSGYVRAVAGEPDLDRIIRVQPEGTVIRSYCPTVGATVVAVSGDPRHSKEHPLIGATVALLDRPKFEGRNHILAEDGLEAIVPFHIGIEKGNFHIQRNFDDSMQFPPMTEDDRNKFRQLQSTGINISPGAIGDATGIFDLNAIWTKRILSLKDDLGKTSNEIQRAAINSRIATMSNPRNARYFAARMLYSVPLSGSAVVSDPDGLLPGIPNHSSDVSWPVDLWFGAWDADAVSGYVLGYLGVPMAKAQTNIGLTEMMSDPTQRRG